MKSKLLSLVVLLFAMSGCESLSDAASGVREKLAREEPRHRTFSAPQRAVYEAVRIAAAQMSYRFVRGGPAQGEFEAISAVRQGETHGSSRQLSLKARMHATLDGNGTDLTVSIMEIIEADSTNRSGMATETPLRDTPQYEVFFRRVQQALDTAQAPKT